MNEKEFRRLNRTELVEIIYHLQLEAQQLKDENANLRQSLESKEIKIANAGSIAQAAMDLSGVFQTAQAAADQYLMEVQRGNDKAQAECDEMIAAAKAKAEDIIKEAEAEAAVARKQAEAQRNEAAQTKAEAQLQAEQTLNEAQNRADAILQAATAKVKQMLRASGALTKK